MLLIYFWGLGNLSQLCLGANKLSGSSNITNIFATKFLLQGMFWVIMIAGLKIGAVKDPVQFNGVSKIRM